jgi:hypothetical protein
LKQFKAGMAGTEAVAKAQAEERMMEARLARAMLNIKELQATAQPPRDELTAPLVGARDFVKDRIQLDLANAQDAQLRQNLIVAQELLNHAKARLETMNKLWEVGSATRLELMRAEVELRERELEMEQLLQRRQRLLEAVKRDPQ